MLNCKKTVFYILITALLFSMFACQKKKEQSTESAAPAVTNFTGTYQILGLLGQMQIDQKANVATITLIFRDNVPIGPYSLSVYGSKIPLSSDISTILTGVAQDGYLLFSPDGTTVSAPMVTLNTDSFNLKQKMTSIQQRTIARKFGYQEGQAWNAYRERNFTKALNLFDSASKYDANNFSLLFGKFACSLMLNKTDDAKQYLAAIKALPPQILNDEFFKYPLQNAENNLNALIAINENKNGFMDFMQSLNTLPPQFIDVDEEVANIINGQQDIGYRIKRKVDDITIPLSQSATFLESAAAKEQFIDFNLLGEGPDRGKATNLGIMYLLVGKETEFEKSYEDALKSYRTLWIVGQRLYNFNSYVKQISVDYRYMANSALEHLVDTKYETEADIKHFLESIRDLEKRDTPLVFADFICHDPQIGLLPDYYLLWVKEEYVRVKLQLLELKAAVKLKRITTNHLPASDADLVPTFISAIPEDPFTKQKVRYGIINGVFTAYSVGPDGMDDHGQVPYDPTNGAFSRGDIAVFMK